MRHRVSDNMGSVLLALIGAVALFVSATAAGPVAAVPPHPTVRLPAGA